MKHNQGRFTGAGKLPLFYQSWHPKDPATAVLAIVHGLGEHSGRYMNVVHHLVPRGFAVYGFDHRGHGRSPGHRGHIKAYSQFRKDVGQFLKMVRKREEQRPVFLMGHSMGGGIVVNYGLHHPQGLAGIMVSAPAIGRLMVNAGLALAIRVFSRLLPRLSMNNGLDLTAISRDQAVVQAYREDPLVHDKGTPRLGREMINNARWCMAHAKRWKPPLFILHGDADRLVDVNQSRLFFEQIPQPDKQLMVYEGGYHESHNDVHYPRVVSDLATWLEQHMG